MGPCAPLGRLYPSGRALSPSGKAVFMWLYSCLIKKGTLGDIRVIVLCIIKKGTFGDLDPTDSEQACDHL